MAQKYWGFPYNIYGWLSLAFGLVGCTLYSINLVWPLGFDATDQAVVSILIVLVLLSATAFQITHFKYEAGKITHPLKFAGSFIFIGFIIVALVVMVLNMACMQMSTRHAAQANASGNLGVFDGFRMLGQRITDKDLEDVSNWGEGIGSMIRALFLCIPFLIVTWGALSALTANSMSEMDGALFSFVASMLFTIEVWMFQLANVVLGY